MEEAHLALLRELGTNEAPHTGRTLIDHLRGTSELLESWGRPARVVLGGLFHSIYGTQSYQIQSISLGERDRIRTAIGEEAELLAYLFCVTQRRSFFCQLESPSPVLYDQAARRETPVTKQIVCDLIEIELANYVDFLADTPLTRSETVSFQESVEAAQGHISTCAYEAALAAARRGLASCTA